LIRSYVGKGPNPKICEVVFINPWDAIPMKGVPVQVSFPSGRNIYPNLSPGPPAIKYGLLEMHY
jgi:hypothetical protein